MIYLHRFALRGIINNPEVDSCSRDCNVEILKLNNVEISTSGTLSEFTVCAHLITNAAMLSFVKSG